VHFFCVAATVVSETIAKQHAIQCVIEVSVPKGRWCHRPGPLDSYDC
jgi:hypothetical protein